MHLPSGELVLFDDIDSEEVSRHRWRALTKPGKTTYAMTHVRLPDGRRSTVLMHRLIVGFPKGGIDHINRNGLDNRRANLRLATQSQNNANCRPKSHTGLKGVVQNRNRWQAKGQVDGVPVYLGSFASPEEAARAHDAWAVEAFGEYAYLNFPV